MAEYNELVKRLREDKSWVEQGTTETEHEIAKHIQQAADAIEELSDIARTTATIIENEKDMRVIAKTPRWIPVSERLPEVGKKVLVFAYGNDTLTARMQKQTENEHPVFECNGIFLEMAKLGRITHWMPQPEPPKGEDDVDTD